MPAHKTLRIVVHSDNNNGEKHGTFTGPPPKMRVDLNDLVRWNLQVVPNDAGATFEITFPGPSSPFLDANGRPILSITDSQELPAVTEALFHYSVTVTAKGGRFQIRHCPELEVGGG